MKKPLILVSNDDGIVAPGIKALVECMKEIGEVVVVAPDSPQSAKGHAITITDPLRLRKVDVFDGIEAYECSGTPADCVKMAKHTVLKNRNIDLCVSGINHGSNSSINIIYSGTMSAAMEASLDGIPSIGFSLEDFSFEANFEPCKEYLIKIAKWVLTQKGNNPSLLYNVNFPKLEEGQKFKGTKVCHQANANWVEDFQEKETPYGAKYYWMTGHFENYDESPNADVNALKEGFISIVPSQHDLTNHKALGNPLLKELNINE